MKRHTLFIYMAALLTMLSTALPMSAQQKQDALYIFRNDGKFNAFYYADIERIAYSHIDTLGVAHDEIVVQEVYALDSIFRIPLSSIDSVAFITPSTVYKPDVIRPNQSMTDYIVESDTVSWFRLAANTPKDVVPKIGDKILIEDAVPYLPEGFSGIVTKVDESATGYVVTTDDVALQDLYDRVVIKAAGYCASNKPTFARHRLGGELIDDQYKSAEEFEPFELSGSFTPANVSVNLFNAFKDNFGISLEGSFTLSYNCKPIVKEIRSFLYADVSQGVKYNILVKMDREEEFKFTPSGTLGTSLDIPISPLKAIKNWIWKNKGKQFYKKYGLFNVNLSFGVFIKGSGTISADMFYHWEGETMFSIGYDKPFLHVPELSDFEVHTASRNKEGTDSLSMNGWGLGLSASVGFYAKATTSVTFLQRRFEAEARVEAGVRIEENIPYITNEIASTPLLKTQKYYDMLNTDETVSRVWFTNFNLGFKRKLIGKVDYSLFSFSPELTFWRTAMGGTVPEIMDIRWIVDKKAPWRGDLTTWLKRELWFSKEIGYGIFDISPDLEEPKEIAQIWCRAPYSSASVWNRWGETIDNLEPGRNYRAFPLVKLLGYPVITDKQVEFTLGPPSINPEKDYIEFGDFLSTDSVNVATNVANTEFKTDAKWLKLTWYKEIGRLDLICDQLPDIGEDIRKADVIGIGYDKERKEIARDTIKVAQLRPTIGSRYAEFDAKASTKTIKVFTTVTNMEYSFAKTAGNNPDNFCSFNVLNDSTLLITVKENKGPKRTAVIDAKGTSRGGKYASGFVTVIQEGTGEETPFDPADPESFKLPGDTVDLNYMEYSLDFEVKDESIHSESTSNYFANDYSHEGQRCTATYDGQYLYALLLNENATVYLKIDNNAFAAPIVDGWVILKDGEAFVNMRLKDVPSRSGWEKNEIRFGSRHPGENNENYSPSQSPLTGLSKNLSSYSSYFYANLEHYRDEYEDGYYVPYKKYIILSDENINKLTYFSLYFTLKKYFNNGDNYYSERNNVYLSEFPDSSVIKQVEEAGMPVYLGSNPPPLDMACTLKPYAIANAQGPDDTGYLNLLLFKEERKDLLPDYMHVKFTPTEDKNVLFEVAYDYSSSPLGTLYKQAYGTAKIRHSYGKFAIQGDGNRFTLSRLVKNPGGSELMMISGEIDGENIKNLYFLGADKLEESFSLSTYSAAYTLIYDGDYISESFNWDEMDWSTWIMSNDDDDGGDDARRRAPFIPMKIPANSR